MYIIAQVFGFLAAAFCILSFQQNKHKNIIALQLLGGISFTIHFCLLGIHGEKAAFTAAAMNLVDVARSLVYINRGKKWADHVWWVLVFSLMCVLSCILTWGGPISLLSMGGMILTTISFYLQNPAKVRLVSLPASLLWILNNLFVRSYSGILTEGFNIFSMIIAMLRHDLKLFKKKEISK